MTTDLALGALVLGALAGALALGALAGALTSALLDALLTGVARFIEGRRR